MNKVLPLRLSRRERQIMDVLYRRSEATVAEVLEELPDPPSYSAVRAHLRILEEKGQVVHVDDRNRYVYKPAESWTSVARTAIDHVVQTFFGGSIEQAVATLLTDQKSRPTEAELSRLEDLIQQARSSSAGEKQ